MIQTYEEYEELNKNKLISLEQLKKEKHIMEKWKLGCKYVQGFADFKNGRGNSLEIFEMIDYTPSVKYRDQAGIWYDCIIHLKNLITNQEITIDQDDRFGYFTLLDKNRRENIENSYYELKEKTDKLGKFIEIMEKV